MPVTPSVMSLHLRYRLWIAEMNFDINVLRIFNDYLAALSTKKEESEVNKGISQFEQQFTDLRKEIDDLRNEMHLLKMKLAAFAREKKPLDYKTYQTDNHTALKKRYLAFRDHFEKIKKEFGNFESKWLN
jgi:chromosome segregation ATPase